MDRRRFLEASTLIAGSTLLKRGGDTGAFAAMPRIDIADQRMIGIQVGQYRSSTKVPRGCLMVYVSWRISTQSSSAISTSILESGDCAAGINDKSL